MTTDEYLWDRSGTPDADVERLERVLGRLGTEWPIPNLRPLPHVRSLVTSKAIGLVAALVTIVVGGVIARVVWTPWILTTVEGSQRVAGGRVIETDDRSRALLSVGVIGTVEIAPSSRVKVIRTNAWQHHLGLEVGRLRANINAPARWFVVDTPAATATDLGCVYTLEIDAAGSGILRVQEGWVQLDGERRQAIVPAGAAALVARGRGPGSPYYEDASEAFRRALATVNFAETSAGDAALTQLLREARTRDSLTLLSLLDSVRPSHRAPLYDRLAPLLPPPSGVTRDAVLDGDRAALDRWWERLALERPPKTYPQLWKLLW